MRYSHEICGLSLPQQVGLIWLLVAILLVGLCWANRPDRP